MLKKTILLLLISVSMVSCSSAEDTLIPASVDLNKKRLASLDTSRFLPIYNNP